MTAEIVLMNRNAVALAADSAGTIKTLTGSKTTPTMNKLFALSYEHSIGIMIYNSSYFMGLPWETIIHTLRERVKGKEFDTLEEFESYFIDFLENNEMFDRRKQMESAMAELENHHRILLEYVMKNLKQRDGHSDNLTDSDAVFLRKEDVNIIREKLSDYIDIISNDIEYQNNFDEILDHLEHELDHVGFIVYEQMYDEIKDLIKEVNRAFFNRMIRMYVSGVVISGFGKKDFIPKTISMVVERVLGNKLAGLSEEIIDCAKSPQILAYAQRETIDSFIFGMNQGFEKYIQNILKTKCSDAADEILKDIRGYPSAVFVAPVYRAVSSMSKTELAMMAESLINLSSFRLKITNEVETVGGPIDVAVITKSEGFIWVKRKFYFDSELNPHYTAKFYK
ncbi:MAG: hypothetical protein FWE54_04060 [Methanimicrococcus sp.]|nr:hypothetical protein [Methanimicrococcus sp.]